LPHLRNVLEIGGLPHGISKDLPRGIRKMGIFHRVKDIPRGEGYDVSSHKHKLSEETTMSLTMKGKHAVTKQLTLTYKSAGKKEKGKIL